MQLNKSRTMCVNKQEKKSLTITKNKIKKIKRHVQIKIFNLVRQDIYLIVLAKFVH